ncbi:hypothetical protein GLOTRDRAFT_124182 [Gloeophyllum trabeum ATCC 11539]|uniref:Uncharacterized protein n=1 Tax=Gloeophyllum trabeum (strain ATCC 11539 / FP-39264 / Madison 617) TaxID=670483 RepID=S7QKT5_GLOTA|nr:uncharacterized protein GLOTRDRAFT_124182 [Gloeophyllum trabeum ATCC 11539]EPQ60426.1 hypothetical protein GLOTRDRAFT_124182 [Gloeophyllum trabeum ATCC 11539]
MTPSEYKYHHVRSDSGSALPFLPDDHKLRPYRDSEESDIESPLTPTFPRHSFSSSSSSLNNLFTKRRRWLFVTCAFLSVASITVLSILLVLTNKEPAPSVVDESENLPQIDLSQCAQPPQPQVVPPWDKSTVLLGAPTKSFRGTLCAADNLRPDKQYITSWWSAGWTNDVMTAANLIYLGLITGRTPIIPPFTPSHIGGDVPPIPFGEVFNVSRLAQALGRPVLEWHDVKEIRNNSELGWSLPSVPAEGEEPQTNVTTWEVQQDVVGCWNTWESVQYNEHFPRRSSVPHWLGLDISYTRLPASIKLIPNFVHDMHTTFWALAQYAFPQGRAEALSRMPEDGGELIRPADASGQRLEPDEQMMCLDYLYYVSARTPFEFEKDYSPAWREVATHMHWTDRLQEITNGFIRKAFELPEGADIPPIQADLLASRNISVPAAHVLMTSDEQDAAWWAQVRAMGWRWIDHGAEETAARLGRWYPVLVDAVVQSGGVGFVGTDRSTMSLMAQRRVEDWQGGVTRTVKWGSVDADAH